jgi:hypothetical protein
MAAPTLVQTYPAHGDTGIPVGSVLRLWFGNVVDPKTVKDSLILHGPDFDFMTGPGSTNFIGENASNPFFLSSPGFKGVAPLELSYKYFDLNTLDEVTATVTDETDAVAQELGTLVEIRLAPEFNAQFAGETEYTLTVIGDPDDQGVGISTATIYDHEVVAVTGDGFVSFDGCYTGLADDVIHVEITRAGNVNEAKYKFWYESAGEGTAVTGRLVSTKYRLLDEGVKIRFFGEAFAVGDEWKVAVAAPQRLATSTKVVFTTSDTTLVAAPESPSTPATSSPPPSVIPAFAVEETFRVVSMTPRDGSYNNANPREIVLVFSSDIDPDSVDADSLKLFSYPVEGLYEYAAEPRPLAYTFDVDDNVLTIRI